VFSAEAINGASGLGVFADVRAITGRRRGSRWRMTLEPYHTRVMPAVNLQIPPTLRHRAPTSFHPDQAESPMPLRRGLMLNTAQASGPRSHLLGIVQPMALLCHSVPSLRRPDLVLLLAYGLW
jgi:hypothetical protein